MKFTSYFKPSLAVLIALSALTSWAQAPEKAPAQAVSSVSSIHTADDVDTFRETQLGLSTKGYAGLVWWIPFEYWAQSEEKRGNSAEKAREQMKALRDYTLIGVFAGKISPLASVDYITPSELEKHTFLRDSDGQDYPALTELTGDAKNLAAILKPILANAMGRAGENFAIFFFPATNKKGKRIADETSKGNFSVVLKEILGEQETIFVWRTPLTSLSPARYCPIGKERVHADWDYCPRHGVKLEGNQ